MGNQKYIISSLLLIIVILLSFITFLLFQKPNNQNTNVTEKAKQETKLRKEKDTNSKKPKRLASQPEVYLGSNIKIPKNIGCVDIGQYGENKKPSQEDLVNSLTKEQLSSLNSRISKGWTFQQACKADNNTVAYSLFNNDNTNKNIPNILIVAFSETESALFTFGDERINKPKDGEKACKIYKLTTNFLEYSCNTDNGIKKWQLPFDIKKKLIPLN